jgi:hypothetical protein
MRAQPRRGRIGRHGRRVQIALERAAAGIARKYRLLRALHAFRHHVQAQVVRQLDHQLDHGVGVVAARHAAQETLIELDGADRQRAQDS